MDKTTVLVCRPKTLSKAQLVRAAEEAIRINPVNRPPIERMSGLMRGFRATPQRIAVMTTAYWGPKGVKLTVGFLDNPPANLRKRILGHMNAWNRDANVSFVTSNVDPDVRISRVGGRNGGYWSYVGTQIRQIPPDEATMNLEAFTMKTEDAEFYRVVRHETGHTLGFPHEHMRRELVQKIDRKKAIAYFKREDDWTPQETNDQVLTPIEESTLIGTAADPKSIMCYQLPGEITKDGKPIIGGLDIDESDYSFAGRIYPKTTKAKFQKSGAHKKR
jgi:Astacin (Peptidase family M12A)